MPEPASAKAHTLKQLVLTALPGIPEVLAGDPVSRLVVDALARARLELESGDVLVIAQKIISKAEARQVCLSDVTAGAHAQALAQRTDKDPRLVELMLQESKGVVREKRGVVIVEHRLGFIMANAGIDRSNVSQELETVLLLPEDPDESAARLRAALRSACGVDIGVVINDSFGRAWRSGIAGVAIGVAGVPALVDRRGELDREGRPLGVTQVAAADELAAAASLLMGQAAEGIPAVHVRGFPYAPRESSAQELVRPREEDLFR